jgi:hypothetical protein
MFYATIIIGSKLRASQRDKDALTRRAAELLTEAAASASGDMLMRSSCFMFHV